MPPQTSARISDTVELAVCSIASPVLQPPSCLRHHCDNRLWVTDVGMSRYYGGSIEVLEIVDDEVLTVLRYQETSARPSQGGFQHR